MSNPIKVAIYSGAIPSTTFIERLISGLAFNNTTEVLLFGSINKRVEYQGQVIRIGFRKTKWSKLLHFLKYNLLLKLFKNESRRKLDQILKSENRYNHFNRLKFYPVLWHQPDVFHLQWAKGVQDWMWVQQFDMKLVLSLRGAHINYSPLANPRLAQRYRDCFPKVDAFHAVSRAIALEASKYGASSDITKVVYSGLHLKNESSIPKSNQMFTMISVGRPHWKKGFSYAIDACKLLKDKGFQFKYTIVGGYDNIELVYQIHDLGLQDNISLVPNKPFLEVKAMVTSSDLFLLPSVEEGIANVVLESMLLKTLVLTTDCGGMTEVVEDGVNGFVVPIRDSKSIADKVIKISQYSENDINDILDNAFNKVKKNHNQDQMIEGMVQLYNELLDA